HLYLRESASSLPNACRHSRKSLKLCPNKAAAWTGRAFLHRRRKQWHHRRSAKPRNHFALRQKESPVASLPRDCPQRWFPSGGALHSRQCAVPGPHRSRGTHLVRQGWLDLLRKRVPRCVAGYRLHWWFAGHTTWCGRRLPKHWKAARWVQSSTCPLGRIGPRGSSTSNPGKVARAVEPAVPYSASRLRGRTLWWGR